MHPLKKSFVVYDVQYPPLASRVKITCRGSVMNAASFTEHFSSICVILQPQYDLNHLVLNVRLLFFSWALFLYHVSNFPAFLLLFKSVLTPYGCTTLSQPTDRHARARWTLLHLTLEKNFPGGMGLELISLAQPSNGNEEMANKSSNFIVQILTMMNSEFFIIWILHIVWIPHKNDTVSIRITWWDRKHIGVDGLEVQ